MRPRADGRTDLSAAARSSCTAQGSITRYGPCKAAGSPSAGWNVLAVDLPGHGRSAGPVLASIGALSDWLLALMNAAAIERAVLIGHSMGSLIVLETAARAPERTLQLVLIGSAAAMPVHPDLLTAARENRHEAIDMVNLWGYGPRAGLGGSAAPGIWMTGAGERILERARPGVLYADLAACNAYGTLLEAARKVRAPTLLISGERDQMTPLKSALKLAAAIPGARLQRLAAAGHMLMAERPDELLAAFKSELLAAPAG